MLRDYKPKKINLRYITGHNVKAKLDRNLNQQLLLDVIVD